MTILNIRDVEAHTPQSRTADNGRHIQRITVKTDSSGQIAQTVQNLCDSIALVGIGKDAQGAYYRIAQYRDKITKQTQTVALPCGEIGSQQGFRQMQQLGITVYSGRRTRNGWQIICRKQAAWNTGR